jgi:hypothetical protein
MMMMMMMMIMIHENLAEKPALELHFSWQTWWVSLPKKVQPGSFALCLALSLSDAQENRSCVTMWVRLPSKFMASQDSYKVSRYNNRDVGDARFRGHYCVIICVGRKPDLSHF